jgi:hypothetical protein
MQLNWNYNMDETSFATYFGVTILVSLLCGGVLLVMFLMSEYISKFIRRKKKKSFWDFGEK